MRWLVYITIGLLSACQGIPEQQGDVVAINDAVEHALPQWQSPRERDHARLGQILDTRTYLLNHRTINHF